MPIYSMLEWTVLELLHIAVPFFIIHQCWRDTSVSPVLSKKVVLALQYKPVRVP